MTNLVAYHRKTADLALFESDGEFWVGSYSPHLTHQNGEPPYSLIDGYYDSIEAGMEALERKKGDEF